MSNKLVFKNLWYGKIVDEDYKVYNTRHSADKNRFEEIINSYGIKIITTIEISNGSYRYLLKLKDGREVNAFFTSLKRSGIPNNEKMRAYIYPPIVSYQHLLKNDNTPIFIFAAYNSGDEIIFVSSEFSSFLKKSNINKNYASFWIGDFQHIVETYQNKEHFWSRKERGESDRYIFKASIFSKIKSMKYDDFVRRFLTLSSNIEIPELTAEKVSKVIDDYMVDPAAYNASLRKKCERVYLARNKNYRLAALKKANYICELCGKKHTFLDRDGHEYFDGHHLIMYNPSTQSRYEKSLDIPRNIICLCPECHKKVHFSSNEVIKDIVVSLFMNHRDLLDIYDIESLDEIINDYLSSREEKI